MTIDWPSQPTPPEPRSRKGAATRQRLILAAARLFAERGIDRVAPHEILEAAGQRNASAIQYHFGSHEGLVVAILQPRADIRQPIDALRNRLLDDLAASGRIMDLEDAVRAWVVPTAAVLATPEGRDFIRVAVQVIRLLPLANRVTPSQHSERRAQAVVADHLVHLPAEVAAERMGGAFTLMNELYANRAREITQELPSHLPQGQFEAELTAMITGMLSARPASVG